MLFQQVLKITPLKLKKYDLNLKEGQSILMQNNLDEPWLYTSVDPDKSDIANLEFLPDIMYVAKIQDIKRHHWNSAYNTLFFEDGRELTINLDETDKNYTSQTSVFFVEYVYKNLTS